MDFLKVLFVVMLFAPVALAQNESDAYCSYVKEQAQAEAIRLRTPASQTGVTQEPIVGGIPQKFTGVTNSLSDDRKSVLVGRAAAADCGLYRTTLAVQRRITYALPAMERDALQNRLTLIQSALDELDRTSTEMKARVAVQDATVQSEYLLASARQKLVMDRTSTTLALAAIYVPELAQGKLMDLAAAKQGYELTKQRADNQVSNQQGWDVAIALGERQDVFPLFGSKNKGAYGNFTVTYNLGAHASAQHLEAAAKAYGTYKAVQQNDALQQIEILKKQVTESIAAREGSLAQLKEQDKLIGAHMMTVKEVDSAAAITFRNQLLADSLALRVEMGDAQFRLDALKKYLAENLQ